MLEQGRRVFDLEQGGARRMSKASCVRQLNLLADVLPGGQGHKLMKYNDFAEGASFVALPLPH